MLGAVKQTSPPSYLSALTPAEEISILRAREQHVASGVDWADPKQGTSSAPSTHSARPSYLAHAIGIVQAGALGAFPSIKRESTFVRSGNYTSSRQHRPVRCSCEDENTAGMSLYAAMLGVGKTRKCHVGGSW